MATVGILHEIRCRPCLSAADCTDWIAICSSLRCGFTLAIGNVWVFPLGFQLLGRGVPGNDKPAARSSKKMPC